MLQLTINNQTYTIASTADFAGYVTTQLGQRKRYALENALLNEMVSVASETEKALKFRVVSEFGIFEFWAPKSSFAQSVQERAKVGQKRETAMEKYEKLVAFCKEQKVKGARNGMKKWTLVDKMSPEQRERAKELGLI